MAFKLAIVGRQINNKKWESVLEVIKQGVEEDFWEYTLFEIDRINPGSINWKEYNYHIYLATKPLIEDESKYIRFMSSVSEEELVNKMQEFVDRIINNDNSKNADLDNTNNDPINSHILENIGGIANNIAHISSIINNSEIDNTINRIIDIDSFLEEDKVITKEKPSLLLGVKIEVNGKDILLNKEDMLELKQTMELMEKFNFKIKDIIV